MQTRRLSAVWFADIVGFTAYASQNEDAAVEHVQAFQELSHKLIEAEHHGRCVKFIGDAVLAEFSSADAAVRAAIALRNAFAEYCRSASFDSSLRIGVHIGEVLSMPDGDIYGDGVNTASRLQKEAAPGQVLISEDVWRQLRQRPEFRFDSLGELELRGITARIAVFNVGLGGAPRTVNDATVVALPPTTLPRPQKRRAVLPLVLTVAGIGALAFGAWQLVGGPKTEVKAVAPTEAAPAAQTPATVPAAAPPPATPPAASSVPPKTRAPRTAAAAPESSAVISAAAEKPAKPPVSEPEPDLTDRAALESRFTAMLNAFAHAIGQRDLPKANTVYAGLTQSELDAYYPEGATGTLSASAERVRLIRVDASSATVNFLLVFAGLDTRPFRARLERAPNGWRIVQVVSLL